MRTIDDILAAWSEIAQQAPYKAVLPDSSNGHLHIHDKDGHEIAACFASRAARNATAIAAALNFVASRAQPAETVDEPPPGVPLRVAKREF